MHVYNRCNCIPWPESISKHVRIHCIVSREESVWRERDRNTETERQRRRQTETETETVRDRQRDRQRRRQRQTEIDRQRDRERYEIILIIYKPTLVSINDCSTVIRSVK